MKESFNSLRLLLLFVGLYGILSFIIIGIDSSYVEFLKSPISALSLLGNAFFTLAFLYLAATLHTLLPMKKRIIQAGVAVWFFYKLLFILYEVNIGKDFTDVGISALVILVVSGYLILSIERLSKNQI